MDTEPVYFHVQWFEALSQFMDAPARSYDAARFAKMVPRDTFGKHFDFLFENFPRKVLQPYFLMDEASWAGTDIIKADNVNQLVFMHTIPEYKLPNDAHIYFLNTIISFPSKDYANLILQDPYVINVMDTDWQL